MRTPLCVFTPQVGTISETFIRRHVKDLLPGGTVAITCQVGDPARSSWSVDGPMLVLDHIEPVRFTRETGWEFASSHLDAIKGYLQENRVQVVLGEYLDVCLPLLEIALELDIPFWGHAHGYDISMRLRDPDMRDKYLRYSDGAGVIVGCEWARERLIRLGLPTQKLYVAACGVAVPKRPVIRSFRGQIRCLAVGRFVPKKGPLFTLAAIRKALKVCPNLRLDFIGSGEMLPAAQEEAMAHNLPVVATRHAGIPEAVKEGITGFLVNEGNTIGMAEYVVRLAHVGELRDRMGNAGRTRIVERFCWGDERLALLDLFGLRNGTDGTAAA